MFFSGGSCTIFIPEFKNPIVMTSYQSKNMIQEKLGEIIPEQVAVCRECDELPPALEELILHNFQAKYVCYNKMNATVEVGIEEMEATDTYPRIKTHTFRLEQAVSWLGKTFRKEEQDLKFYAQLIAQNGTSQRIDEVVLV